MYSILLVDDEAVVRLGVKNCVNWERLGITQVLEASNGVQAIETMRRMMVDIVITDLKMAVMGGLLMLKALDEMPDKPEILVMSCYNDYENMRAAMQLGARDFLFKPSMYPADIEDSLERVIERMESGKDVGVRFERAMEKMSSSNALDIADELISRLEAEETVSPETACRIAAGYALKMQFVDAGDDKAIHACAAELLERSSELRHAKSAKSVAAVIRRCTQPMRQVHIERDKTELIYDYIESHLSDPNLSLEQVSEEFGFSPSYFSRFFKSSFGCGYNNHLIQRRILLAQKLKQTTNLTPDEIAMKVGYQNKDYFAKLYRRQTGTSLHAGKGSAV